MPLEDDDAELLSIVHSQPRDSPEREAACQALVLRYRWLVTTSAQRYRSPELSEDLIQVGYVGLLKAINSFDPAVGDNLAAYARPCITGEIKRYFRDKGWPVHVQRSVQELRLRMRAATVELTQQLQRTPADAEIAAHLGVSEQNLAVARDADSAFQPASLDAPLAGGSSAGDGSWELADLIGAVDTQLEQVIDLEAVAVYWPQLPPVQQQVLMMRFWGNMTQADIAAQLGISQMHVSRLQARALAYLRTAIAEAERDGADPAGRLLLTQPADPGRPTANPASGRRSTA
jgi:RNA polymerase sigma-B factor